MGTAEFFAERWERADFTAFDRITRRKGGEPPGPDDSPTIRWSELRRAAALRSTEWENAMSNETCGQ
jgi:hypothetical protein